MKLLLHGFHFHRLRLTRFFTLFPFRPQTLLSKYQSPAKHTTYWHRPHTSTTKLPVVFIHGIGIGLYPYTSFLSELNSKSGIESEDPNDQVGIIAIELMPVSFRITNSALARTELCYEIDQILHKHFTPDQNFVLVSHSYGTVSVPRFLSFPALESEDITLGKLLTLELLGNRNSPPQNAIYCRTHRPYRSNRPSVYPAAPTRCCL
jgi:hypothetical protein